MGSEMVTWLNKAARAIYLATDAAVAHDISPKLREAATLLSSQEAALAKIADPNTVAGMHEQDRAPRLQEIARAAISPLPEGGQ